MTAGSDSERDRGDWGADPELRALVHRGDVAHSLPPLTTAELADLVSATLVADRSGHTGSSTRRSRLPLLVAAAVLMIAGVGAFGVVGGSSDTPSAGPRPAAPVPSADPSPATPPAPVAPTTSGAAGPTVLTAPSVPNLKCMVPNVEVLRAQSLAFEGTVTAVAGSLVTLATTTDFRGEPADAVLIEAPGPQMQVLLSAVDFEVGKTYLVSATDGQVTLCGFSAETSPDLRALYEQAFAG